MFESHSRKDISEHFWLASLLHSIMWLAWFELSIDRPNTTNIYIYIACEKGDWAFDSAINVTEESAWTTVVFLALFLRNLCSAWSYILHWANFILIPLWVSHLEVEEASLFHAYWAISSYGLCFCRCFLTLDLITNAVYHEMIFFYLCLIRWPTEDMQQIKKFLQNK